MVPLALIHNFSLLLSLSLLSGLLMRWFLRRGSSYTLLMGLLFGAATLVGMSTPVIQQPGLIFDGRSIVLGIAGLFGGPLVAGIAATMAATYRIQIGGPGALMGVLVILESSLLGIGGYYFRQRRKERVGPLTLLTLGLAIHLVMLALLLSLPGGLRLETLQRWGLIILFGYPLAFMVVGLAFLELERHFLTEEALRASEERHRGYVENAPDGVFITDDSGAYLDVNQAACKITGYSRDELLTKHIPDLLHPDSLEVGLKHFASLMEKGSASGEMLFLKKDGSLRWWVVDAVSIGENRFLGFAKDITERKKAEASLKQAEWKFQALFEQGPIAVAYHRMVYDEAGQPTDYFFLDANEKYIELTGVDPRGKNVTAAFPGIEKDPFDWIGTFARVARTGETVRFEQYLEANGRWYDCVGYQYKPDHFVAAFLEITKRKQAEEALRESEERWKFAIEGAGDGLWDWNVQTGMAYYSPRYKEMLGYADDEIGTTADEWTKRMHPEDAPVVFAALHPFMEGRPGHATFEFRMLCKDGTWRWIQGRGMVVSRTPDGKPLRMIGINSDITEQKETKESLAEQSTALSAVIDNNPMSIQILDNEGRTIRTNPAFLKLFGAVPPPGYCMFSDTTLATQGLAPLIDRIRAGEIVYFPEVPYNVHDLFPELPDSPVWVRALGFPIMGKGDRPERFVLMHEDVSQRRYSEQAKADLQAQLQQSQKMESLGTLAGGVAHDMNNVLGAILGLASAHMGNQPSGSPLHQALDTICKATERGGKMVKSLLSFSRQNLSEISRLDVNAILKEEVALLERTTLAKVRLVLDLEADLHPIQGDASPLSHAFMNICINAVDAMPEGGTLTLHTHNLDNSWIEIVVEDTGVGMAKEVLEKALDPFFTTKEVGKGTGLGLSMVFSTVKAHGGQIAIDSEPGKGTRVRLLFPSCESDCQVAAVDVAEATVAPKRTLKVLLVDDDDLIQSSSQALLEALGHTAVRSAKSGEAALAMLEAGFEPDLVILDMNMPGLGGVGTLPHLRALCPGVPVLLSTGRTDQTALALASAHPGVTLLPKPYGLVEFQKHLENIGLG